MFLKNDKINDEINDKINDKIKNDDIQILSQIKRNKYITIPELSKIIQKSTPTIYRHIKTLESNNILKRIGSRKTGYREIIDNNF